MLKRFFSIGCTSVALATTFFLSAGNAYADQATSPLKAAGLQLRTMSESIHRAKRAANDLIMECQRQDAMVGGEIDFIGSEVIPIMPETAEGYGPPVYIPPRKKYVDLHMSQLSGLMPILQEDITAVPALNSYEQMKEAPDISQMQDLMKDAQSHYANLQGLTQGIVQDADYNSSGLQNESKALLEDFNQLDKLRKDIWNIVRRDPNKDAATVATPASPVNQGQR